MAQPRRANLPRAAVPADYRTVHRTTFLLTPTQNKALETKLPDYRIEPLPGARSHRHACLAIERAIAESDIVDVLWNMGQVDKAWPNAPIVDCGGNPERHAARNRGGYVAVCNPTLTPADHIRNLLHANPRILTDPHPAPESKLISGDVRPYATMAVHVYTMSQADILGCVLASETGLHYLAIHTFTGLSLDVPVVGGGLYGEATWQYDPEHNALSFFPGGGDSYTHPAPLWIYRSRYYESVAGAMTWSVWREVGYTTIFVFSRCERFPPQPALPQPLVTETLFDAADFSGRSVNAPGRTTAAFFAHCQRYNVDLTRVFSIGPYAFATDSSHTVAAIPKAFLCELRKHALHNSRTPSLFQSLSSIAKSVIKTYHMTPEAELLALRAAVPIAFTADLEFEIQSMTPISALTYRITAHATALTFGHSFWGPLTRLTATAGAAALAVYLAYRYYTTRRRVYTLARTATDAVVRSLVTATLSLRAAMRGAFHSFLRAWRMAALHTPAPEPAATDIRRLIARLSGRPSPGHALGLSQSDRDDPTFAFPTRLPQPVRAWLGLDAELGDPQPRPVLEWLGLYPELGDPQPTTSFNLEPTPTRRQRALLRYDACVAWLHARLRGVLARCLGIDPRWPMTGGALLYGLLVAPFYEEPIKTFLSRYVRYPSALFGVFELAAAIWQGHPPTTRVLPLIMHSSLDGLSLRHRIAAHFTYNLATCMPQPYAPILAWAVILHRILLPKARLLLRDTLPIHDEGYAFMAPEGVYHGACNMPGVISEAPVPPSNVFSALTALATPVEDPVKNAQRRNVQLASIGIAGATPEAFAKVPSNLEKAIRGRAQLENADRPLMERTFITWVKLHAERLLGNVANHRRAVVRSIPSFETWLETQPARSRPALIEARNSLLLMGRGVNKKDFMTSIFGKSELVNTSKPAGRDLKISRAITTRQNRFKVLVGPFVSACSKHARIIFGLYSPFLYAVGYTREQLGQYMDFMRSVFPNGVWSERDCSKWDATLGIYKILTEIFLIEEYYGADTYRPLDLGLSIGDLMRASINRTGFAGDYLYTTVGTRGSGDYWTTFLSTLRNMFTGVFIFCLQTGRTVDDILTSYTNGAPIYMSMTGGDDDLTVHVRTQMVATPVVSRLVRGPDTELIDEFTNPIVNKILSTERGFNMVSYLRTANGPESAISSALLEERKDEKMAMQLPDNRYTDAVRLNLAAVSDYEYRQPIDGGIDWDAGFSAFGFLPKTVSTYDHRLTTFYASRPWKTMGVGGQPVVVWGPKIGRAIGKLGWFLSKPPDKLAEYVRGAALQGLKDCFHVPVLRVIYTHLVRICGQGPSRLEYDEKYHFHGTAVHQLYDDGLFHMVYGFQYDQLEDWLNHELGQVTQLPITLSNPLLVQITLLDN